MNKQSLTAIDNSFITNLRDSSNMVLNADHYFSYYIKHGTHQQNYEQQQLYAICSYIAQNNNPPINIQGQPQSCIGLYANDLIKQFSSLKRLAQGLIDCANVLKFKEQVKQSIQNLAYQIYELDKYSDLFYTAINNVLGTQLPYKSYSQDLQHLAWLLYIDFRSYQCLPPSINWTEHTNKCLIASVFYFITRYSYEYTNPSIINQKMHDKKTCILAILNHLLQIFQIQSIDDFRQITTVFDEYINNLIQTCNIYTHKNESDFLSPLIVSINIKMLNNKYQKSLSSQSLDLRIFKNKNSFSPLRKKIKKYHLMHRNHQYTFRSSKILQQQKNFNKSSFINDQSSQSYNFESRLTNHTQWQIYRFYNNHTQEITQQNIRSINIKIKEIFQETVYPVFEDYQNQIRIEAINIFHKFYYMLQNLFSKNLDVLEHKYIYLAAVSLFLVLNLFEEKYYAFSQVLGELINYYPIYQIWNIVKQVGQKGAYISDFPANLIQKAESQIICQLTLKSQQILDTLTKMVRGRQMIKNQIEIYLKEVINESKKFIISFDKQLLADKQQKICEEAFAIFKLSLYQQKLIKDKDLHQILLCCIYLSAKVHQQSIKFIDLSNIYDKKYPQKTCKIFSEIKINFKQSSSLIEFYNNIFLQKAKKFLSFISETQGNFSQYFVHELFQIQLYPNRQLSQRLHQIMDILQTSKPNQKLKNKKKQSQEYKGQQRHQTRVRMRPNNNSNYYHNLCNTKKNKN